MSVFRPLYDWALLQAKKPYAKHLLFFVAMIEPCLIPIPPDILLIPMVIARREKAYKFALICTIGSVLGGLIGYGIGALGMATIGKQIVEAYNLQSAFEMGRAEFHKWGMLIILAKGFTPIPFIIVAIISGMTHFNLGVFIFSATLTRGGRFFLEAFLIRKFGAPVQNFIEKYLTWIALGVLAVIVGGVWLVLGH
jgi:membrane protein YqaA with SNARE-associated domain